MCYTGHIRLSPAAWEKFVLMLQEDREPSAAMIGAGERYKKMVVQRVKTTETGEHA